MKRKLKHFTAVLTAMILSATGVSSLTYAEGTREVLVTNTEELLAALSDAQAGDEIIVREGLYQHGDWIGIWAVFYAKADGTADRPIILRSEDPEHPATLSGVTQENKVGLRIDGSYWEIRDLVICEAAKGIFLTQSEHSVISGCEVYNIGGEAIHIIDNSSYNLVENCYVHDAGTITPQYGEGVYIGSAHSTEGYGFECHYNTVRGCRFGPNVAADHVDIKEYTIGNVVEECYFDGTGIQGQNGGDSFVEIKGNNCIVRNNVGYRNGCEKMKYAFDANVQIDGWGQNNLIYDNTLYLDITDVYIFKEWNCATQVFRNYAEPQGATYTVSQTMQVLSFDLEGDATEDGMVNYEDVIRLRRHLLGKNTHHISGKNADIKADSALNAFDLCALKRAVLTGEQATDPIISVDYVKEDAGKWRMSDGLGGRHVTFCVQGAAGSEINTGWGYWDGEYENTDGSKGKWFQIDLGSLKFNENGSAETTVEVPARVRRVAFEAYDYTNTTGTLDLDSVVLSEVIVQ